MSKMSLEEIKSELIGKTINWLTIIDVYHSDKVHRKVCLCRCKCGNMKEVKLKKILSGHTKSCGCYNKSSEYRNKQRQWRDDNKDKVTEMTNNMIKWYEENKELLEKRGKKYSEWAANNKEKVSEINAKRSKVYEANRRNSDISELLNIIHPDYIQDLVDGKLTTHSMVKTKCPVCSEYDDHYLNNVFRFKTSKFRYKPPLCKSCKNSFTSSHYENEIADYISTFYAGKLIKNDRTVLNGKELDLYYPEKKIAIEFNGNYWHSEEFKDKNYHFNKFIQCKMSGVFLISIFETEWNCNTTVIEQYLYDTFNNKSNKLSYSDGGMNNNYPDITVPLCDYSRHIEHSYLYNGKLVYTCGYTEISV